MTPGDAVIETRALRRTFGSKVAVAELSLTVRRGEVFGFLGPNGAGKTTALKMLLGLVPPSAGGGRMLGAPLGDRAARARTGFLPEHFRFHDWMTGREMLRFHGRLYGLRGADLEARIEGLLERVDLADAAGRALSGYSKGMLQRAGLAQALINDPDIVFLDEPTSGLDPLGRRLVRGLIGECRARGTTVFLNSHLLGEVEATCDRVVFVKAGRAIGERDLHARPPRLEVELRVSPADGAVREALGRFGAVRSAGDGLLRVAVEDEAACPAIARAVVTAGGELHLLRPHRPSLEELFLEIMGDDQRPG